MLLRESLHGLLRDMTLLLHVMPGLSTPAGWLGITRAAFQMQMPEPHHGAFESEAPGLNLRVYVLRFPDINALLVPG